MASNAVKQRQVILTAGEYTSIEIESMAHFMLLWEDGNRGSVFNYRLPGDGFSATFTTRAGDPIKLYGEGKYGALGVPASAYSSGIPADGTVVIQIQEAAGLAVPLNILEAQSEVTPQAAF